MKSLVRNYMWLTLITIMIVITLGFVTGCSNQDKPPVTIHSFKYTENDDDDVWVYWYSTQSGLYQSFQSNTPINVTSRTITSGNWSTSNRPPSEGKENVQEEPEQEIEMEQEVAETGGEGLAETQQEAFDNVDSVSSASTSGADSGSSSGGDSGGGGE